MYRDEKTGREVAPQTSWTTRLTVLIGLSALVGGGLIGAGVVDGQDVVKRIRALDPKALIHQLKTVAAK